MEIGFIFDMLVMFVNFSERVVCLEFRCVGVVFNDKEFVWNLIIYVEIIVIESRCRFLL